MALVLLMLLELGLLVDVSAESDALRGTSVLGNNH